MQGDPTREYAECWLLEVAVEGMIPLAYLRPDVVEEALNRSGHGVDVPELSRVLEEMFQSGLLFAQILDPSGSAVRDITPSRTEIERFIMQPLGACYGLTQHGGTLWERASRPNWADYIVGSLDTSTGVYEVGSGSRAVLDAYFQNEEVRRAIAPGTYLEQTVDRWQATYWKVLPVGYRATCTVTPPDRDFPLAEARSWFTQCRRKGEG